MPKRFRFEGNHQVGADRDNRPEHIRRAVEGSVPAWHYISTCSIGTASIRAVPIEEVARAVGGLVKQASLG